MASAGRVQGITIELGADASGIKAALAGVNSSLRDTQKDLRNINKGLRLDPTNVTLAQQKFNTLQQSINNTKEKITTLKQAESQLKSEMQNGGTAEQQRQLAALQREIIACESRLKSFQNTIGSGSATLANLGARFEQLGQKFTNIGQKLTPISAAMTAFGVASVAAFKNVDQGSKNVIYTTGAIGDKANVIRDAYKNVAGSVAGSFEDIGNTVGQVAVRFGATGEGLENLSRSFQQFATITNQSGASAVAGVDMALRLFNVDASQAGNVMGLLTNAMQETGKPAGELLQTLQSAGPTFKEMGLGIGGSVQLMTAFQKQGIDSTEMMTKMRKAATEFSASGKDMGTGLRDLVARLQDSSTHAKAAQEAYKIFGKRAGLAFVQAAEEGKISLDGLSDSLDGYSDVVAKTYDETRTGADKIAGAWKQIQLALEEVGNAIGDTVGPMLKDIATGLKEFGKWFGSLPEPIKKVAVGFGLFVAAAAPVLLVLGKLTTGLGGIFKSLSKSSNVFTKAFQTIGEKISGFVSNFGTAGSAAKGVEKDIKDAGKGIQEGGTKASGGFKEMAGSALQIIAVGGALALAGVGFKQMADGCKEIGEAGPGANVALAEMGGILIGFMAVVGRVAQGLSSAALGLVAFGGSVLMAGVGIKQLSDAAIELSSAGAGTQITLLAIGVGIVGLAAALGAIGTAFAAATPFLLGFGVAVAGIGAGIGAATWGIGQLAFGIADVIRALTEYATATGLAKQNTDETKSAFDTLTTVAGQMVGSFGNIAEGITGAFAGVGDMLHGLGLETIAWALNDIANAQERMAANAGAAQSAIYGLGGASDSAGGALNNLAGTGQNTTNIIRAAFDGLSGSIFGVSRQIAGSLSSGFNDGKNSAINSAWEIRNGFLGILDGIAAEAYWKGRNAGERFADGARETKGSVQSAINPSNKLSSAFKPMKMMSYGLLANGDNGLLTSIPVDYNYLSNTRNQTSNYEVIKMAVKDAIKGQKFGNSYTANVNGARYNDESGINRIVANFIRDLQRIGAM